MVNQNKYIVNVSDEAALMFESVLVHAVNYSVSRICV